MIINKNLFVAVLSLMIFFLCRNVMFSQKVYATDYASQADIKVYVVDYESQADLKVFIEEYSSNAAGNRGQWCFVKYDSRADKKIFFVEYASQSDLKICFVKYRSRSGWTNNSKKHLLY